LSMRSPSFLISCRPAQPAQFTRHRRAYPRDVPPRSPRRLRTPPSPPHWQAHRQNHRSTPSSQPTPKIRTFWPVKRRYGTEPDRNAVLATTLRNEVSKAHMFECIRTEMKKGSPEGYNAENGYSQPARKPETGEPNERQPLYRIRCTQEKYQLLREDCRRDHRGRKHAASDAPGAT